MKQRLQGMVMGALLMVLLLSATVVYANNRVTREITYGINVMLNGEMVQFDYDTRPFVMDGRTFLPLRTLAELVGLPVDFDPATNTAIVGSTVTRRGTPIGELFFDGTSLLTSNSLSTSNVFVRAEESVLIGGNTLNNVVVFNTRRTSTGGQQNQSAMLNLNNRYQWLDIGIGSVDGSTRTIDAEISIYFDDRLVETFEQSGTSLPREMRLFVEGVRNVRVEITTTIGANQTKTYAIIGFAE